MLGFLVKRPVDSGGSCTLRQRLLFVFCWYTLLIGMNCAGVDLSKLDWNFPTASNPSCVIAGQSIVEYNGSLDVSQITESDSKRLTFMFFDVERNERICEVLLPAGCLKPSEPGGCYCDRSESDTWYFVMSDIAKSKHSNHTVLLRVTDDDLNSRTMDNTHAQTYPLVAEQEAVTLTSNPTTEDFTFTAEGNEHKVFKAEKDQIFDFTFTVTNLLTPYTIKLQPSNGAEQSVTTGETVSVSGQNVPGNLTMSYEETSQCARSGTYSLKLEIKTGGGDDLVKIIVPIVFIVIIAVALATALLLFCMIFKPRRDFNKTVTAFFLASKKAKSLTVTMKSTNNVADLRKQLELSKECRVHQAHNGKKELKDEDQHHKLLSKGSNGNVVQTMNVRVTKGHDEKFLFLDADQGVSSKTVALVTQTKANIIVSDFITSLGLTATTVFEADACGNKVKLNLNDQLSVESKEILVTVMYGGRNTIILAGVLQGEHGSTVNKAIASTPLFGGPLLPHIGKQRNPEENEALNSTAHTIIITETELKKMKKKIKEADSDGKKGKKFQNKVSSDEEVDKDEETTKDPPYDEFKASGLRQLPVPPSKNSDTGPNMSYNSGLPLNTPFSTGIQPSSGRLAPLSHTPSSEKTWADKSPRPLPPSPLTAQAQQVSGEGNVASEPNESPRRKKKKRSKGTSGKNKND